MECARYIKLGERAGLDEVWQKKLENASARFHISRLEAVQTGIQQQLELLYGNQVDSLDRLLRRIVGNGYTYTAFEIQKGVGIGWDITGLNQKKLETLLAKPWTTDGRTFRDRCWTNKNDLVGSVSKSLTQGLLRGDSPARITTAIQKQFGVHRYKAARLINTETTYFNAVASKECYRDLDVRMVEIIETLDSRTCSVCGGLDGKVIPISQYEPGVTVPPFHPNCRGTTAPAIDAEYAGERAARDADGKVYYVPADMQYSKWKKMFVDGGSKDGLTRAYSIVNLTESAIIEPKIAESGGVMLYNIGKLDIDKYKCVTSRIATDEVIITNERIEHIRERHPNDYERYYSYIPRVIGEPDYIVEANKAHTAVVMKEIEENGEKFKLILRLKVEDDPEEYKNSVISFWRIGDTTWRKMIKNKTILYKRE